MGGNRSQGCWARRWWLVAVLAACLAGAAPAQAQPFVYVANLNLASVSQYDAMGGALLPLAPASVLAGGEPAGVAVSPDGKSVYVTNNGAFGIASNTVHQFDVGAGGTLTPKTPATVPAGSEPFGVAVSPDGESVYVANFGDSTVSQYDVGAGGALTPKTPATVAAGPGGEASQIAVSPDGRSVYVANAFGFSVSQYDVGAGGALTPKTPATVAAGSGVAGVAVSPDGKSVYVADDFDDTVSQYDVGLGGVLIPKAPATVATGSSPFGVAVSPDGKSVYVTNEGIPNAGGDTVSQYDIGAGGALVPKAPATVAAGSRPVAVAVSPDGESVYVANSGDSTVSQYDITGVGALTPKTPATVTAGTAPFAIAVSPLPIEHTTSTSVSCSPSVFAPGDATVCTATVTDTAGSGQTKPTGTVSFTNSGAGRFFGSPCTLSGSGASASCVVFFTSFARGGHLIAAGYGGDAAHRASRAIAGVSVAVPVSTAGCVVFGHGRIIAGNGDRASFRGLVAATPPRGVEFYRDKGPANAMRVASASVEALTCTDDATKASVFGTAKINGAGSFEYRIDVQLTSWERGKDTYRIRLSNGYDSGAQKIRHGDVDIRTHSSERHHHDANADHYKAGAGPDGG